MPILIGTSWKMNLTSSQASAYCDALKPLVEDLADRELFILPPFTSIWAVRASLEGSRIAWGAQHVHPEDAGPHTGDVSAPMLADLGCSYVEVGHSERRRRYGESDAFVAAQVSSIQRWGMRALVCVGEQDRVGLQAAVNLIAPQVAALSSADPRMLVVAYEPVWAVGEGAQAAGPTWIGEVHHAIHNQLNELFPAAVRVPVIYGGSVDSRVAAAILEATGVDGLFVGRSALDAQGFARIAHAAL